MSERVKVINPNDSHYGIKINQGTREIDIKPKQTIYLSVEDVEYQDTTSDTFKRRFLEIVPESVDDKEWLGTIELGIKIDGLSEDEIKEKLNSNMGTFNKYMKEIRERNDLNERKQIFKVSESLDLPYSKIKAIENATGFNFDYEKDL